MGAGASGAAGVAVVGVHPRARVADLCALLGYEPMPEQEAFLDAVFAVGSDGLPAVPHRDRHRGRQNLKTGEFVATAFGWLYITEEERTLWSAHEFGTTRTPSC